MACGQAFCEDAITTARWGRRQPNCIFCLHCPITMLILLMMMVMTMMMMMRLMAVMMMTMTTLMMMISKPQSFVHSPRDDAIDYDGYDVDNDDDDGADDDNIDDDKQTSKYCT